MQHKVLVNGANGKMGSFAAKTIEEHPDFELVATLTIDDNLHKSIIETKAEIVIDLTTAEAVYENSLTIINANVHPVIGTSGLLSDQILQLQHISEEKNLGGIIVPNFSVSAVLMMKFAAMAAKFLPEVEIIEAHHPQKVDAPSGTALKTAEVIAQSRQNYIKYTNVETRELVQGAKGANYQDVNIHAIRLPGVLARQEVIFGNAGETLSITHNSIDRASFMPGVVLACQEVKSLKRLHYGLEDLMDI